MLPAAPPNSTTSTTSDACCERMLALGDVARWTTSPLSPGAASSRGGGSSRSGPRSLNSESEQDHRYLAPPPPPVDSPTAGGRRTPTGARVRLCESRHRWFRGDRRWPGTPTAVLPRTRRTASLSPCPVLPSDRSPYSPGPFRSGRRCLSAPRWRCHSDRMLERCLFCLEIEVGLQHLGLLVDDVDP